MAKEMLGTSAPQDEELPSAGVTASGKITSLGKTLSSVMDVGRVILARRRNVQPVLAAPRSASVLATLCQSLLDHKGEASGLALASEIVAGYNQLGESDRLEFFCRLAEDFEVDRSTVLAAAERYREDPELKNLWALNRASEAPRQKLFRRMNTAPEGTRTLVAMRGHLLQVLGGNPELRGVDLDLKHLFISWFNKGFLELRRIDWTSPAAVLEKIIGYEAVHEINGWDDLRSRLRDDRRCFAFFHPALKDDPLVFVEIALTDCIPDALAPLLVQDREEFSVAQANTMVFYSISNCHPGLASVSFGNFLIKSVIEEMCSEFPNLKTFVTLSPVPGFRKWLLDCKLEDFLEGPLVDRVREPVGKVLDAEVFDALRKLCAHYLLQEKSGRLPRDPVARFHLGNGAQLYQLHGAADMSAKGRDQSASMMVNYLYDLPRIEENHDAYFDEAKMAASRAVRRLID